MANTPFDLVFVGPPSSHLRLPPTPLSLGYISEEWGLVDSLRELGLGGNKFTGAIPSELCGLAVLERLDLHENKLNSKIPSELGQLVALKRLRLHGTRRGGTR